jgi:hypothetical protein
MEMQRMVKDMLENKETEDYQGELSSVSLTNCFEFVEGRESADYLFTLDHTPNIYEILSH